MRCLTVELVDRSYPINIGEGLLSQAGLILPHLRTPRVALVSNTTVAPLYLDALASGLQKVGVGITPIILPDGEAYKTWESLNLIYDALLAA
ncbi:MAG: 3-dehydroquinate synthase, partial [Sulfuritalea sp.]|nr:3-dehydroquinate synthase [Sulfuritalea sp.]